MFKNILLIPNNLYGNKSFPLSRVKVKRRIKVYKTMKIMTVLEFVMWMQEGRK